MREVLSGHEIVRLQGCVDVFSMDAESYAHDHVLGTLDDLLVDLHQVCPFKSLKTEVIIVKITVIDDGRVETLLVL